MHETIGERAQRRALTRTKIAICILVIVVMGASVGFMIRNDPNQSKGAIGIVRGSGTELEAVFIGPPELKVDWDGVTGQAWSVSLVQGRIRNISNKTVRFQDIVYRVKDGNGDTIWEGSDGRFADGGKLEPTQYLNFVANPITNRESKIFEVVVKNATVSSR
ncbi:MAG: hypothetical protein PHV74_08130 [Dehalococcoidia bacterium]|nr:hypothetical protein [Dehalococcoidia bacterium]